MQKQSNILITGAQLIDHAVRICGISTSQITPEIIQQGKENLLFVLMEFNNRGLTPFSEKPKIMGLQPQKWQYFLEKNIIDILDCNWRTASHFQTYVTGGNTIIDPQFVNDMQWDTYAITSDYILLTVNGVFYFKYFNIFFYDDQEVTLTFSASSDGINYTIIAEFPRTLYFNGDSIWYDLLTPYQGSYLKVSVATGETLFCRGFYTGYQFREIPIARMNRDDFFAYTQKGQVGTPLNYYFHKSLPPYIWLWNAPASSYQVFEWCIHYFVYDTIDQIISLSKEVDVPVWFLDAIKFSLASKMSWELPSVPSDRRNEIILEAEKMIKLAEYNNSDNSNINLLSSVLTPYTRCI